jgi:hypothetical protein
MHWLVCSAVYAMYPSTEHFPGAQELGFYAWFSQFRREATWTLWAGALLGGLLFQLSPVLTLGLPVPAALLSADRLDEHAFRLCTHRWYLVRQGAFLVKMIGGLYWGSQPVIRARIGLEPYPADPGTWRSA